MRKLFFLSLFCACTGFISCQKEIEGLVSGRDTIASGGGGSIPPSTNGNLLIKVYGKQGSDSVVSYYTYDANSKIASKTDISSVAGAVRSWYGYQRNIAGLITVAKQYITTSVSPIQPDTATTTYYYSTATVPQITYSIMVQTTVGISIMDSVVYTYNSAGKLTKTTDYQLDPFGGGSTIQATVQNFTYDAAGNMTKIEIASLVGGMSTQLSTTTYTYDSKNDPFNFTEADAIIVNGEPEAAHNHLSQSLVSTGGAPSYTFNYTYVYNNANKPATGAGTQAPGNLVTNYTFYYR